MYVAGIRCCLVSKQANQSPTATKASSSKAETKTTRHDAEERAEAVAEVSDTEEIDECVNMLSHRMIGLNMKVPNSSI